MDEWARLVTAPYIGVASVLYNYKAVNDDELTLLRGQTVFIYSKDDLVTGDVGWVTFASFFGVWNLISPWQFKCSGWEKLSSDAVCFHSILYLRTRQRVQIRLPSQLLLAKLQAHRSLHRRNLLHALQHQTALNNHPRVSRSRRTTTPHVDRRSRCIKWMRRANTRRLTHHSKACELLPLHIITHIRTPSSSRITGIPERILDHRPV
eukprot:m.493630 g.493630  ORF g.493630 m.493630 type:complete len:207 (+) comp57286_c0_seq11:97-717(+)